MFYFIFYYNNVTANTNFTNDPLANEYFTNAVTFNYKLNIGVCKGFYCICPTNVFATYAYIDNSYLLI